MKHLYTYNESIDELQQWINAVLENCKDIMLDMQDLGFKIEVKRSLYMQERNSVIVECRMGSDRLVGVNYKRGWGKELIETYERLNSYMSTEGFEELKRLTRINEFKFGNGLYWAEILFRRSNLDSDFIGHLRYLKRYNIE
jgi:hypothetical protein